MKFYQSLKIENEPKIRYSVALIVDKLRIQPYQSGMALLPLAAVNVNRFVTVVSGIAQQLPVEQQPKLLKAFEILIQPQVLDKITTGGYEGRMNRLKFKKDFEVFVKDIHSFLVFL